MRVQSRTGKGRILYMSISEQHAACGNAIDYSFEFHLLLISRTCILVCQGVHFTQTH